ncbi:acidic leucine-rich nuclear phosphoprotein 32-related protein-like [Oryza sativa Japonica Group]|uniref:acidic leucine-rich nuclear phosphoprotein 32-related protein-like n=1 Tax=Oryza sativa subsp. japonica TaxID=39947 RepID=UPI00339CCA87
MVVLVHHQAYWSNLPNEDAMVLQDGSTNTKHAKTDLIGCIGDGCSHADAFLPSCVVLMDTNAARDCDLRLLRSVSELISLDFVADEEEVEDTEEDEYIDEDGDSDDDEDEGEEDDDDEGEEDDDEHRSENDDNDGAETGRSGEQADAATDVTCCKGDDTNEGIGSGGKGADDVTGCNGDDTNEGIASGGKGADDVIGKGKQVDEGIGFGDKDKHEEKQAPNAAAQNVPESEKQPVQKAEKYPFLTTTIDSHEVPNFNLGFDSSQEVVQTPKGQEATGTSRGKEFPRIITNEDYGSFTTEDYEKVGREADEAIASKSATKSPVAEVISKEPIADDCEVEEEIPVPHEYN